MKDWNDNLNRKVAAVEIKVAECRTRNDKI
jgi:hypothetical protein